MHVVSRKKLLEASKIYPDVKKPLDVWYRVSKSAQWQNLEAVKETYRDVEAVEEYTIFNIKGNRYRLIVGIDYSSETIYVKGLLTHADYSKDKWKDECRTRRRKIRDSPL